MTPTFTTVHHALLAALGYKVTHKPGAGNNDIYEVWHPKGHRHDWAYSPERAWEKAAPLDANLISAALAQLLVTAEQRWNFNAAIHEGLSGPSRFAFDILTSRPDIEREVKGGE